MVKDLTPMQEKVFDPWSRRSAGEGTGNPLQYSCLENSVGRGAWWATVRGVAESDTTEHLSLSDQLSLSTYILEMGQWRLGSWGNFLKIIQQ